MLVKRQDGRILNLGAAMQFDPITNQPPDDDISFLARFPGNRNFIVKGMTVWFYYMAVAQGETTMEAEWVDEDHYVGASGSLAPPK